MRNGQNKRMRGRNRGGGGGGGGGKGHNPLTKVYESNGPDVKIRGTASHVADKYIQLARDATTSGDPVGAENYYQHAEHYFRLIAAAQEQFRQNAPAYGNRPDGGNEIQTTGNDSRDGTTYDDDGDDEMVPGTGEQPQFGTRDPQPYVPRDAQFYGQNGEQQQQPRHNNHNNNNNNYNNQNAPNGDDHVDRLPSFITGGAQPQGQPQQQPSQGYDNNGGDRGGEQRGDRYGYRRRRHRRGGSGGGREMANNGAPQEGGDESAH